MGEEVNVRGFVLTFECVTKSRQRSLANFGQADDRTTPHLPIGVLERTYEPMKDRRHSLRVPVLRPSGKRIRNRVRPIPGSRPVGIPAIEAGEDIREFDSPGRVIRRGQSSSKCPDNRDRPDLIT